MEEDTDAGVRRHIGGGDRPQLFGDFGKMLLVFGKNTFKTC